MVLLRIASISLTLLSLVLSVVALVSNNWLRDKQSHYGLWKSCPLFCIWYQVPDFFHTTRFFMILAMCTGFLSSFTVVASFCCSHFRSMSLIMVSALSSFSAGVSSMIAMAVFTNAVADAQDFVPRFFSYGWSYGLGWLSSFLYLGTGAVILLPQRSSYIPV